MVNMDFRRLAKALPSQLNDSNNTDPLSITDLPPSILETLIPGYGLISRYILTSFGLDISIFVSIGLVAWIVVKGSTYLFDIIERAFRSTFIASVYIDEHDDLFDMVMGWLSENQPQNSKRSLRAKTQKGSKVDDAFDNTVGDALDENGMFDYTKWSARLPPRFEPYYGRNYIFHRGSLFFFKRSQKQNKGQVQMTWGDPQDDLLQLDCIGRSTDPIKELLREIKIWSLNRLRNTTTIRHPTPKDRARYGGSWSKTSSRPSRPMETVILDAVQKSMIVRDMNEYLHPLSPKWYATRGIPYRRGYLFHGPPGTGKTSLSFALAGIFGLEIFAISLQEPTLTEGDLLQLFNGLPKRCIVLLEDVDAAGLLRDGQSKDAEKPKRRSDKDGESKKEGDKKKEDGKSKKEEEFTLKDLARELKSASAPRGRRDNDGGHPNRAPGTGISLSGLLNAIDGVASAEGRVLIMTTNYPEKLDAALVRPGRVDRKVEFQLARQEQIAELFLRMYAASDQVPDVEVKFRDRSSNGTSKAYTNGQLSKLSEKDLEELALEFAGHVPDDTFTPAELQNHLMKHKKEPRTAVELAARWVKDLLEEKQREAAAREKASAEDEEE